MCALNLGQESAERSHGIEAIAGDFNCGKGRTAENCKETRRSPLNESSLSPLNDLFEGKDSVFWGNCSRGKSSSRGSSSPKTHFTLTTQVTERRQGAFTDTESSESPCSSRPFSLLSVGTSLALWGEKRGGREI